MGKARNNKIESCQTIKTKGFQKEKQFEEKKGEKLGGHFS